MTKTSIPLSDDLRKSIAQLRTLKAEHTARQAAQADVDAKAREESLKHFDPWAIPGFYNPNLPRPSKQPASPTPSTLAPQVEQTKPATTPIPTSAGPRPPLWPVLRKGEARFLIDHDPQQCLTRICQYALNMTPDQEWERAKELFRKFRFKRLYPKAQAGWAARLKREFDKLAKDHRGKGLPLFVVERVVKEVVPKGQRIFNTSSGAKRQDIQPVEFAYVLKSIVISLRKRGSKRPELMARAYFLTPKFRENYKKATGRQLNTGKPARITDLLHQHGLLEKVRASKFAPLHFKLGPKSLLIPQVPVSSAKVSARVAKEGK